MESHLLQMRGLKHQAKLNGSGKLESHLLQMRGLKLVSSVVNVKPMLVASFTDAWIETEQKKYSPGVNSRIFYRCVD